MTAPSKFHDVAIAIHEALEDLQATYAFLGGYAIAAMGAPRNECRGIDCVVDCDKEWLVSHLRGYSQFRYMANAGTDKARFLYGPEDLMLVFFLMPMIRMRSSLFEVDGEERGSARIKVLDPVLIFKAKLQVAASRIRASDASDIEWLQGRYRVMIIGRRYELHQGQIGEILRRFPRLEPVFARLAVDIDSCRRLAREAQNYIVLPATSGALQSALSYGI